MADTAWATIVATAAPLTPILSPNISIGSRIIFIIAPIVTVIIPIFANPCVFTNGFIPSAICTNTVPIRYIPK